MYASITEANVFTALRAFLLTVVDCEVVRTQVNRVAMPKGDFIALTPSSMTALETNTDTFNATQKTILRPQQFNVQVDCYGTRSADRANAITALFRDEYATASFLASGFDIQPLFAEDPHQMPLINGEEQYTERWTFELAMQVNPVLTIVQQTANVLTPGVISVERTFPP